MSGRHELIRDRLMPLFSASKGLCKFFDEGFKMSGIKVIQSVFFRFFVLRDVCVFRNAT
jgi:hypothetical protein